MRTVLVACAVLAAGESAADPKSDAAHVDWARGLVIAGGVGVADRHAPSPAVARGTARRGAEELAKKALAAAVRGLPLAAGGTVADKLGDAAVAARVDRVVAQAFALDADPETDGAWHVTLAVPVEAVRQAIAGPRPIASGKGGDTAPAVVVVDGVGKKLAAVGWTVGGIAAPTLFVDAPPAWAKDAPRVHARGAKAGGVECDAAGGTAATVFVLMP